MLALEIQDLEFGYKDEPILKGISFDVNEGEFLSIIGPNGSGKSTLLKTLNRLYAINSGKIKVHNKDLYSYKSRELAKTIALVPQDTSLDYDFTVEEVVMMGRHPYKGRFEKENNDDVEIVYEAMEMTNTLKLKDRLITEISGGERQRVFIAKALAQKSSIILLDEPTSHLDINHQMDILNLLESLNIEQGMTIVLVIHDINLAARYSDVIILLKNGIIQSKGIPEDVITTENIEMAYNLKVAIEKNKYTNSTYLTPIEIRNRMNTNNSKHIHIICGGGMGKEVINKLYYDGYKLSLGVLNVGDSDWELGKSLRIPVIEEAPFNGISDKAYKRNLEIIQNSDIVIITKVPIGFGNLKNYEAGLKALSSGKKVYLIGKDEYDKFDYTNGQGTKVLSEMKKLGLIEIGDINNLKLTEV